MDIKTSLLITEKEPTTICLITVGIFVYAYNQSYYLLTERLGRKLKPKISWMKNDGNCLVISGGFPINLVECYYPQATKTEWGYHIRGRFDLTGYDSWLAQREAQALAVLGKDEATASSLGVASSKYFQPQSADKPVSNSVENRTLTLSSQQISFLQNWQRGLYPAEVEQGFIESIQKSIQKKC